jgi:TolB-like protein
MKISVYCKILILAGLFPYVLIPQTGHCTVITNDLKNWAQNASHKQTDSGSREALSHIGILYFDNRTRHPNMNILQKGVPLLLTHDLKKIGSIKVVSREKIEALMKETRTNPSDLNEVDTSIYLGGLLQTEYIITGQIQKQVAETYAFIASIIHVPSRAIVDRVTAQGKLFSELRPMEKELLFKIAHSLKLSLNPQEKEKIERSITRNAKALQYYLEAVEKSDQEQYAAANELYGKALNEDPGCILAFSAAQELFNLGLLQAGADRITGEAEAYSEEESLAQKPAVENGGARPDARDPEDQEPETDLFFSTVVDAPDVEIDDDADTPLSILHIRTDATWDMAVDPDSLQTALDHTSQDPVLRGQTDQKNTIPGWFRPEGATFGFPGHWSGEPYGIESIYGNENVNMGLQTMGQDGYAGTPKLFLNQTTLEKINNDGFLAYAIQVEEDRLNRKIIEMHDNRMIRSTLYTAEKYKGIRDRDAWLMLKADAQAGRVLKDINGNWVRVQQYVLRPDAETVQLLNVSLRNGNHNLAGLSTINWTTSFSEPYIGDLRNLPWSNWLNTQEMIADGQTIRYVAGSSENRPPLLEGMSVTFTNPGNESLSNQRTFAESHMDSSPDYKQKITGESLQITTIDTDNTYRMTMGGSPGSGEFTITADSSTASGFSYLLGSTANRMDVRFFVLGDGDTLDNRGEMPGYRNTIAFTDIWDSLRVNESGATQIGNNNLEIQIDSGMRFYEKPIDTIYIPMSRMVWKSEQSADSNP